MVTSLSGRIALVTGASRGIRRGIALELARSGAKVVALARDAALLDGLIREAPAGFMFAQACDLADASAFAPLTDYIRGTFGHLGILVSSAAVMGPRSLLGELSEHDWAAVFATNVTANWRLIKHLGAMMDKSTAPRAIFLTSGSGRRSCAGARRLCHPERRARRGGAHVGRGSGRNKAARQFR